MGAGFYSGGTGQKLAAVAGFGTGWILMRLFRFCLALWMAVGLAASAPAAERYLEFVQKLRDRKYFDEATAYLEELAADPNVPADVREVLDFERAVTLQQSAQTIVNPKARTEQLAAAEEAMKKFVAEHPQHPLAGQASLAQAELLLSKAKDVIARAKLPDNQAQKSKLQSQAREYLSQARGAFQTAYDRQQAEVQKFPSFIPEDQKEQRAAREAAESKMLNAQLRLAICTYEEAQSYDRDSKQFQELLSKASAEFEEIFIKHRTRGAGLYARMWQGKCFEEQGDIRKALGFYDELLGHPQIDLLDDLQNNVKRFRLICLNDPQQKDYQVAIDEASNWLKDPDHRALSESGLGIRWERARAYELLASDREQAEQEKARLLKLGLADAEEISRYPSPYKDQATAMLQRFNSALNRGSNDPKDFAQAYTLAEDQMRQIASLKDIAAEAAEGAERNEAEQDLELHLNESSRVLQLALSLADDRTDAKQVNAIRYYLAYVHLLKRRNEDAAVLAEHVAQQLKTTDAQMAQDAAYLALAAGQQAYNDAPEETRDEEADMMADVCRFITKTWPDHERANEARMNLGFLYNRLQRPEESARWYSEVPESAAEYGAAQVNAGQAYWTAYLNATVKSAEQKPLPEALKTWLVAAEQHLRTGIEKMTAAGSKDDPAPDDLIAAKVSLSQILSNSGNYQECVQVLTAEPFSVMEAIAVPEGRQRPEKGIRSVEFAGFAWQQLLRAYVGTQQIDQALQAMDGLESVASTAGDEAVSAVYVQLGRELEQEFKRLREQGATDRLKEVQTSFDRFLGEMFKRKAGQPYGVLIWIAETYYGLGMGFEGTPGAGTDYFRQAAAMYEEILRRAATESDFLDEPRQFVVKLRLANCRRQQKEFQAGLDVLREALAAKPKALDAQIAAAQLLEDWGASGQSARYLDAINGLTNPADGAPVWGWARIAVRLQQFIDAGNADEDYRKRYFDARYHISDCRRRYGLAQTGPARETNLNSAKNELEVMAALTGEFPEENWKQFDAMYRSIQKDLGQTPKALEKKAAVAASAKPEAEAAAQKVEPNAPPAAAPTPEHVTTAAESGSGFWFWPMMLGVAAGGAVIVYFVMKKPPKRQRSAYDRMVQSAPLELPFSNPDKPLTKGPPKSTRAPQRTKPLEKRGLTE